MENWKKKMCERYVTYTYVYDGLMMYALIEFNSELQHSFQE